MLDPQLCRIFKIDPFMEWVQNKLDDLEDELYSGKLETETYLQVKAAYDALIEARDTYWKLTSKQVHKDGKAADT